SRRPVSHRWKRRRCSPHASLLSQEQALSVRIKARRTHMAEQPLSPNSASSKDSDARVRPNRSSPPSTPGWVKVFVIILIILILLFVILHLTGNGFGSHMHMSTIEHGVYQL